MNHPGCARPKSQQYEPEGRDKNLCVRLCVPGLLFTTTCLWILWMVIFWSVETDNDRIMSSFWTLNTPKIKNGNKSNFISFWPNNKSHLLEQTTRPNDMTLISIHQVWIRFQIQINFNGGPIKYRPIFAFN